MLALPLLADGPVLGVLTIVAGQPNSIDPTEVGLLTELADDLAYGITALGLPRRMEEGSE